MSMSTLASLPATIYSENTCTFVYGFWRIPACIDGAIDMNRPTPLTCLSRLELSLFVKAASDNNYVEAATQTAVSVSATAFDERPGDASGCGEGGCLPGLAYDGVRDDDGSRWSCNKHLVPDGGQCEIVFSFETPQDIMGMQVSFWKGDERTRSLKVRKCCVQHVVGV